MEREKPVTGEIYHVYNRGVEKRVIFLDTGDYARFAHCLWEFNDSKPAANTERRLPRYDKLTDKFEDRLRTSGTSGVKKRAKLVEILAWCLMPNHFHLMLRQLVDNGIPTFMRKVGTGYVNAFNLARDRVGPLFQGVYKFKHVSREEHFLYLPHYIHLNPCDLVPDTNNKELLAFLDSYRWSSFQDYCGKKNFPSLIEQSFISDIFKSPDIYRQEVIEWLKEGSDTEIQNILLD
ncbi:MAG: transposase [bacterium]|nr:transposase [bacterium]